MIGFTTRGRYNYTYRGKVIGFTPKMVKVEFDGYDYISPEARQRHPEVYPVRMQTSNLHPENLVVSFVNRFPPEI